MYCEVQDVRDMIKDQALDAIIGDESLDEPECEAAIVPIIQAAIEDAGAEIDGYLAKKYELPLPSVPKVIAKYAKDIAVYNLFSRIGIDESDREKNYLNRYRAALKFLELLAEGRVELGFGGHTQAASTGFAVSSNGRLFSRHSMQGM